MTQAHVNPCVQWSLGSTTVLSADLITHILWLVQLNNRYKSYKHAHLYLPSSSFVFLCKKTRQTLSITCTCTLGIPLIYERLSSFPLQPAHSVTPVTLACLWQSGDLPLLWLQHPGSTLATVVEKPSYCTSTARGQQLRYRSKREGGKEWGREGSSSSLLFCCDHTSPTRKRVSSSHITQEVCCSMLHPLSLYLTYRRRGTVEIWCRASSSVIIVQGSLMLFPCSVSLICTVRLLRLLFLK